MSPTETTLLYLDTEAGRVRWTRRALSGLSFTQNVGLSAIEAGIDDYDTIAIVCSILSTEAHLETRKD